MFTKNLIQLTGNVAAAPEVREVGETTVTRARLIHNETVRKVNGELVEKMVVVEIELWGKRGEAFAEYVTTKVPVFVEGKLQYERWEKDGEPRAKLLVRVSDWQFLGRKADREEERSAGAGGSEAGGKGGRWRENGRRSEGGNERRGGRRVA